MGENAILQQLAALKQQMAGFSTTVSPVNPTAATPDPAMLAELQQRRNHYDRRTSTGARSESRPAHCLLQL
jgi:hypothetical protein